jgi:hypothetical protein
VLTEENRQKGKRLPLEYLSGERATQIYRLGKQFTSSIQKKAKAAERKDHAGRDKMTEAAQYPDTQPSQAFCIPILRITWILPISLKSASAMSHP